MRARWAMIALLFLGGCDGEMEVPDAGEPTEGVFMNVSAASERDQINGIAPRMGFKYYLLDISIEARGLGPISIAPFAFTVTLADGAPIMANRRTNEIVDGCTSQPVGPDETLVCRLVFLVLIDAAAPATLRWEDAAESATAEVPPL